MNAIEQIIQSFGIGSPQSATALFGAADATETGTVDFAAQFAAVVESSGHPALDVNSPWKLAEISQATGQITDVTVADAAQSSDSLNAHYTGELQTAIVAPVDTAIVTDLGIEKNTLFPAEAMPTQDAAFQPYAEGIPGLQLVQFAGVEVPEQIAAAEFQPPGVADATLQANRPLFTDIAAAIAGGTVGEGQPSRLLPVAQLEALNAPMSKIDLGVPVSSQPQIQAPAQPQIQSQTPPLAQATNPMVAPANTPAIAAVPVLSAEPAATSVPAAAVTASPLATTAQQLANPVGLTPQASSADSDQSQIPASKIADAIAQKPAAGSTAEAARVKAEERAVEGHLVQNAQKQNVPAASQVAQAANANNATAATKPAPATVQANKANGKNLTGDNKATVPSSQDVAPPAGKQNTTEASQPATPRQDLPPAPARAHTPISWTPERLAGMSESFFSTEAIAGGLSGLRGEASFMNSMGLMGGKPSAALGGQIAKQVNLHVTRAVKNGTNEFTMRLNPNELGSVRVKMSFSEAGRVSAQIFAERPETLELLQREVRGIERAVEAGGHKADGLSFNLDSGSEQSAGKAFADAAREDQLKEQIENGAAEGDGDNTAVENDFNDQTDLATLEKILSRVTPETGLDVRV